MTDALLHLGDDEKEVVTDTDSSPSILPPDSDEDRGSMGTVTNTDDMTTSRDQDMPLRPDQVTPAVPASPSETKPQTQ